MNPCSWPITFGYDTIEAYMILLNALLYFHLLDFNFIDIKCGTHSVVQL